MASLRTRPIIEVLVYLGIAPAWRTVTAVGAPATVLARLSDIVAQTRADELIITGAVHGHVARKRSYELLVGVVRD